MTKRTQEDWAAMARRVAEAQTDDFAELVRLSGLDPTQELMFGEFEGASFSSHDLSRYNLTGANLSACDFSRAKLLSSEFVRTDPGKHFEPIAPPKGYNRVLSARLDQAILGRVIHRPGRDPHLPAEMTPVANLREAADWDEYVKAWRPSPSLPTSDDHLPVGAIFSDAPGLAPELVVVPAGTFMMGSSPEEIAALKNEYAGDWYDAVGPQHEVTIPTPFAVGRFAVTFEEWEWAQSHPDWKRHTKLDPRTPDDAKWGRERRPVINVSWEDATAYCAWLSKVTGKPYRLLSEAEWEYCCRAGTTTKYAFGDTIAKSQAQFSEGRWGSAKQTVEVGSFPPNAWGLHDMHGNVWEWCEDSWHADYSGDPPGDGRVWQGGDPSSRVLRGGSWYFNPRVLRSANRVRYRPDVRFNGIGFRVARIVSPARTL